MARSPVAPTGGPPSLIRWGAVFGGVVLGLSLLLVLTTLWLAAAFPGQATIVRDNLSWFLAGSAVLATFMGGLAAGWLSGVPGAAPGSLNGLTVWGLIVVSSVVLGVPGLLGATGMDVSALSVQAADSTLATPDGQDALWASLVGLLVGALAAGIGGAIGGATTRVPLAVAAPAQQPSRSFASPAPTGSGSGSGSGSTTSAMPHPTHDDGTASGTSAGAADRGDDGGMRSRSSLSEEHRTIDLRGEPAPAGRRPSDEGGRR